MSDYEFIAFSGVWEFVNEYWFKYEIGLLRLVSLGNDLEGGWVWSELSYC